MDSSNRYFTIKKKKTGGGGKSSITVTAPNGGQKWKTNDTYAIKWSKTNAGSYVKIQLLKSNKHLKWISKSTRNDGKHPWKVPATIATGSAYKIKITSTTNSAVTDSSNRYFTIKKKQTGGGGGGGGVTKSRIDGQFTGWDGGSIYGLTNGQYWIQVSYNYCFSYLYFPEVLIYYERGWKMKVTGSSCNPVSVQQLTSVISSRIDGVFNGWDGDSIYALTNGQIWQQTKSAWEWKWAYRPKVLVYYYSGWKMEVDGSSKTVGVTRLN